MDMLVLVYRPSTLPKDKSNRCNLCWIHRLGVREGIYYINSDKKKLFLKNHGCLPVK